MKLSEYRNLLARLTDWTDENGALNDNNLSVIIDEAVNWAYMELVNYSLRWSFRRAIHNDILTAGSDSYDLSDIPDYSKTRFVKVAGNKLVLIEPAQYETYDIIDGNPTEYTDSREYKKLNLTAKVESNSDIVIGYVKSIDRLEYDSTAKPIIDDSPVFDKNYHHYITQGAKAYLADYPDIDAAMANKYYKIFIANVASMYNDDQMILDKEITAIDDIAAKKEQYYDLY